MFELSRHLIDEALEIAHKMDDSGDQVVAIRNTGFYVTTNAGTNSVTLHKFAFGGLVYFIVQEA